MFKKLEGFDYDYLIDTEGNVYRKLTPNQHPQGYLRLGLRAKGVRKHFNVHRLVAQAFIPNPDNKPFVNHIDGNKANNRVENLEWCDQSENMLHAYNTGLKDPSHPKAVEQYTLDGEYVCSYSSREEAAKAVGAWGCNINKAINRGSVCAGFLWRNGGGVK